MTTYAPSGPKVSRRLSFVAFSSLGARQINARQDESQFLGRELHALAIAARLRRSERAFLEPLVPDRQTTPFVVQQLHAIAPLAGKDEQMSGQRIVLKLLGNDRRQAIET